MEVVSNHKRSFQVQHIASGLHVEVRDGALRKRGAKAECGRVYLRRAGCLQATGDLIYSSRAYEPATCEDEVAEYLKIHNIVPERRVPVLGESGTKYRVSFRAHPRAGLLADPLPADRVRRPVAVGEARQREQAPPLRGPHRHGLRPRHRDGAPVRDRRARRAAARHRSRRLRHEGRGRRPPLRAFRALHAADSPAWREAHLAWFLNTDNSEEADAGGPDRQDRQDHDGRHEQAERGQESPDPQPVPPGRAALPGGVALEQA